MPDVIDGVMLHSPGMGSDWDLGVMAAEASPLPDAARRDRLAAREEAKRRRRECVFQLLDEALDAGRLACDWAAETAAAAARGAHAPRCSWVPL
jgi:hypothetical protein